MKQKINKILPKSEFSRNVLTLMTGTTIAQAIPIAISPVLTRIYTPEDFGVFTLFVSITSIFSSIASGRYELAIMLPAKEEDAINVFALGLIIVSSLSFFLMFMVLLFNDFFVNLLGLDKIGFWLYFAPIAVFLLGIFNLLKYFNTRRKYYKDIAISSIIKSITMTIIQLGIGFFKGGALGLISGNMISLASSNVRLFKNVISDRKLISKITIIRIKKMAILYKDFPKFSLVGVLLNALSFHLINILISIHYSALILGFYGLVNRVLGFPSLLIGSSIGEVFFQEANKEKQNTGKALATFLSTMKRLLILAIPIFVFLYFTIEYLFVFFFGGDWAIAGKYAKTIVPLFGIRFISSTVSTVNVIFERQKAGLYINLILLSSSLLCFYITTLLGLEFLIFLRYMVIILSFEYLLLLFYYYKLAEGKF